MKRKVAGVLAAAMAAMINIRKLSKLLKRKIRILKLILKKYQIMQLKF